ncbi:beta strand repeat-containing protein [Maribacter sp. 2308TA10-17]|uniref:beta strand repeat-containing protein n=1 Tax=Maribacter sp. 2308TA10-17 TaxID=3386276 RepID=UPI0039BCA430
MRDSFKFLLLAFFISATLSSQVKIGDNPQNIDPSSVLELESTDKVLVITRVTTAQMNAIVPSSGALCFNTDLQSVHYYNGTQWVNIGGSGGTGGTLTADEIINDQPTIVITSTATGSNFEVAPESITTEQIDDGTINGIDIQPNSIGPGLIQDGSVTQVKLSENSVGPDQLDSDIIGVSVFNNDAGYITAGDVNVVSGDAGNVLDPRPDGAFYDDSSLQMAIDQNTDAIALDTDQSESNEIQNLSLNGTEIGLSQTAGTIDIGPLISAGGSDNQNLTLTGNEIEIENGNTIDLTPILGSGGTDNQNLTLTGNEIEIENGNTIDLTPILGSGGTDNQNLTLTGNEIEIENGNTIDLTPILGSGGGNQNLSSVLGEGNDANASGITNLTTDGMDNTAAANVGFVNAAIAAGTTTLNDGTILIGDALNAPQQLAISGDATMINTGVLTIADDAIDTDKIENATILAEDLNDMGATNGQTLKWNEDAISPGVGGWETGDPVSHTGTAGSIFFADATDPFGPTENNAELFWNNTNTNLGLGTNTPNPLAKMHIAKADVGNLFYGLELHNLSGVDAGGSAAGILFSIEDLDSFGKGAIAYERKGIFGKGDFHFLQNTGSSTANPSLADAVMTIKNDGFVGIGTTEPKATLHVKDDTGPNLSYALEVQKVKGGDSPGSGNSTGILFAVEQAGDFGKGGLVFERMGAFGVGDFHFLQNTLADTSVPELTDKAFSITRDKDVILYGNVIDKNNIGGTPSATSPQNNWVLTNTPSGTQWAAPSGGLPNTATNGQVLTWDEDALGTMPNVGAWVAGAAPIPTGTAGSIFFSDGMGGLVEDAAQISYDNTGNRLNLGGGFASEEQKLNVNGNARATAFLGAVNGSNPAFRFFNDADTGMYSQGVDQLTLKAGDQNILTVRETAGNGNQITANGALELEEELVDITGNVGVAGQVLNSTGAGVAWSEPVIFSMGKINPDGTNNINGAALSGSAGNYAITFPSMRTDADYIIQLTVTGDYRIFVTNQTASGFEVSILNSDGSPLMSPLPIWYYTVSDF